VEEVLGQLQSDVAQSEPSAWDASDGARPGGAADTGHQRRTLPADDAGKSADRAPVDLAQDASFLPEPPLALLEAAGQDAAAELCKPDAAQSVEQSCAAQVFEVRPKRVEWLDEACLEPREQKAPKQPSMELQARAESPQLVEALRDAAAVQLRPEPQVAQAAQQVSQPPAEQSWDAQQVRVVAEPGPAGPKAPRAQQVSRAEPLRWASAEPLVA
jgi:hypothetical protein